MVSGSALHWVAWRDAMAAEGVPITREMFEATFGWKNDPILRRWLGDDASEDRKVAIADGKERAYRAALRQAGLAPLPGAREWVERLHAAGWRQAICSSAPRANIEAVLEVTNLAHDFEVIVAAEDVTLGKPDPQVFLTGARKLGVDLSARDCRRGRRGRRRGGATGRDEVDRRESEGRVGRGSVDPLARGTYRRFLGFAVDALITSLAGI